MTPTGEQLCYTDAYCQTVDARVSTVDASNGGSAVVVLDRTVFYPGDGGQPADRGLIIRRADGRSWTVRSDRKINGAIVHALDGGITARRQAAVALRWG